MKQNEKNDPRALRPLPSEEGERLAEEAFEPDEGYVGIADYCMIAPDEETLSDPDNAVAGGGS